MKSSTRRLLVIVVVWSVSIHILRGYTIINSWVALGRMPTIDDALYNVVKRHRLFGRTWNDIPLAIAHIFQPLLLLAILILVFTSIKERKLKQKWGMITLILVVLEVLLRLTSAYEYLMSM